MPVSRRCNPSGTRRARSSWPTAVCRTCRPCHASVPAPEGALVTPVVVVIVPGVVVAVAVLVALAVVAGMGLHGVFLGIAAASLAGFGLAAIVARRIFGFRIAGELATWWALLRESWPIGANLFVIMLGLRVAPLFLMSYRGPVEVGYLSSAARLAEALNLVADGLMLALFPVFSRLALANPQGLRDLARVSTKLLALVLLALRLR